LIFSTVNVARFLDIDPEIALNSTITKFIKRFEYIEKCALKRGLKMESLDLKTMDELWEEAKSK
jgi:tetrapyrrole methylase family protein/MazG family protein